MKVRELEWRGPVDAFPTTIWEAKTPFGHYVIEEVSASDSPAYEVRFAGGHVISVKDGLNDAKAAAQADYEQRIRSAIEITRSDHTSKSTAARTDAGKTGVTAGETATTSDGGSPGPSPLAVKQTSSDPASGRSQPSPDVSVDESKMPERIWAWPKPRHASKKPDGGWESWKDYDDAIPYIRADLVEPLVEALRIIAGQQQCIDNLMSNTDVANAALSSWEAAQ